MFLYNGAHDVTACNLDIDGFRLGVQQVPGITTATTTIPAVTNITLTGNNFTNNIASAYLGSGFTTVVSKNSLLNNGSGNMFDHTVYLSAANFVTPNLLVSQNYIYGQVGDTCRGTVLVAHGKLPGLKIQNNVLDIEEAADTMGCYGIGIDHGGYNTSTDFSSAVISANTLSNTGGIGIVVANCADCLIEDNVLSFNAAENYGISVGEYAARTTCPDGTACPDVVNDRNTIRNNTIWFGPNAINGLSAGIQIRNEGTGHIIANNTVNYTATTSTGHTVNCFDFTQPIATAYAFINNNHCYSAVTSSLFKWDKTNGATLAAWKAYTISNGFSFDSASKEGAPNFVNSTTSPYDFHPTGLPLLGAGSASSVPATDIVGTPFSNPPAIGAYE
jgi:parallel beta-helix repeat protein